MFHIIASAIWVGVAWKWGDWRNWRKYYSTIEFIIISDLLYNLFTDEYPMWKYVPTTVLPDHEITNLLVMFAIYPAAVLVYLSHFPAHATNKVKIVYILAWAALWSSVELVMRFLHLLEYHNGWCFGYSVLFDIAMFPILRIHYKKPPLAWLVSGVVTTSLLLYFRVPIITPT